MDRRPVKKNPTPTNKNTSGASHSEVKTKENLKLKNVTSDAKKQLSKINTSPTKLNLASTSGSKIKEKPKPKVSTINIKKPSGTAEIKTKEIAKPKASLTILDKKSSDAAKQKLPIVNPHMKRPGDVKSGKEDIDKKTIAVKKNSTPEKKIPERVNVEQRNFTKSLRSRDVSTLSSSASSSSQSTSQSTSTKTSSARAIGSTKKPVNKKANLIVNSPECDKSHEKTIQLKFSPRKNVKILVNSPLRKSNSTTTTKIKQKELSEESFTCKSDSSSICPTDSDSEAIEKKPEHQLSDSAGTTSIDTDSEMKQADDESSISVIEDSDSEKNEPTSKTEKTVDTADKSSSDAEVVEEEIVKEDGFAIVESNFDPQNKKSLIMRSYHDLDSEKNEKTAKTGKTVDTADESCSDAEVVEEEFVEEDGFAIVESNFNQQNKKSPIMRSYHSPIKIQELLRSVEVENALQVDQDLKKQEKDLEDFTIVDKDSDNDST